MVRRKRLLPFVHKTDRIRHHNSRIVPQRIDDFRDSPVRLHPCKLVDLLASGLRKPHLADVRIEAFSRHMPEFLFQLDVCIRPDRRCRRQRTRINGPQHVGASNLQLGVHVGRQSRGAEHLAESQPGFSPCTGPKEAHEVINSPRRDHRVAGFGPRKIDENLPSKPIDGLEQLPTRNQ